MRKTKRKIMKLVSILLILIVVVQQIAPILADNVYAKGVNNQSNETVVEQGEEEESVVQGEVPEGTEDIQEGTEDIQEGTEDIQEGTEDIQEGMEDIQEGTEEAHGAMEEGKENETQAETSSPVEGKEEGHDEDEKDIGAHSLFKPLVELEDEYNLMTSFEFTITYNGSEPTTVDSGDILEVDIENLNAAILKYGFTKPDNVKIEEGDTYTIDLPNFFDGSDMPINIPITVDETQVATYSIVGGEVVITFNKEVNKFDNIEMYVNLSGSFHTEVFEEENEVVVEVPFSDGSSYTTTIKAEQEEYEGKDKKTAGEQYVLDGEEKVTVTRNPEYIDWTVRVNDSMGSFENAQIIDDLGKNLEIVEDSFIIERIIRNYKNDETGREKIADFEVEYTDDGFELDLGSVEDAYDITYTTRVIRPDGGGTHKINNSARIILDGGENKVSDDFDGTWSGDIPVITKEGSLLDDPHIIDWTVEYNYGKENLGMVTLTDTLTHGEVDLDSIVVTQVDVDIDGNIIEGSQKNVEVTPVSYADGNATIPNLDADGKAYLITFSSSVPVGLKATVTNTISDDLKEPNSDDASVPVNTIPIGRKVGEQFVDDEGSPYIEWTITMNSNKVDVPSIIVRDVFSQEHLSFDVDNESLYTLYKDGQEATNFTIVDYTHKPDGREGFRLDISNAGPHEYKFVYRTYYTESGMEQEELANYAELVFLDGSGVGIGEPIDVDYVLGGPKAGIEKFGRYVINEITGLQEIEWTVTFNQSKILLNAGSTITEAFTSRNYTYIADSLTLKDESNNTYVLDTNYSLAVNGDNMGFVVTLLEGTKAELTLTFKTTVDDTKNNKHDNKAILKWQGGSEEATYTVGKRISGSSKSGAVVINADGTKTKTVKWTIDFNTNKNVIHDFKLVDTYTPTTVTVSDIKITSGDMDVTNDFEISPERTGGEFTVEKDKLDAKAYKLTYSTTLSPAEEQQEIKNSAAISYTGGSEKPEKTIAKPTLGVEKEANGINRTGVNPVISWTIHANTDSINKYVNLVDAVLEDTIPEDQKLIAGSIVVTRQDGEVVTDEDKITTTDNSFKIELPDGPYQYNVTFDTEILQMPSLDSEVFDRYNNKAELTNQTKNEDLKQDDSADASIRYYKDVGNNLTGKTGKQNSDTENIDYNITINPEGLTINNTKVTDTLSINHQYVEDSIKVMDADSKELTSGYTLTVADDNRSFTIVFEGGTINKSYQISYSTRLNPNLVGTYEVTNSIVLTGGAEDRELNKTEKKTSSQQWFYGGGGSGRVLNFDFGKKTPGGKTLSGAKFTLERVDINETIVIDGNIVTGSALYNATKQRAGRYKLTETEAPKGYQELTEPIYFAVGYSESGVEGEYTITIMDSNWKAKANPNATAEGNVLTVVNNYKPVSQGFEANKTLTGLDLKAEQFSFELLDESGKVVAGAKNDVSGEITFAEQSFSQPGTYNFKMREVDGGLGGINYDTREFNVQVIIVEGDNGLEVESVKYLDVPEFKNTYVPASTNAVIKASKILEGQTLKEGQFEFQLLDSSENILQTATNMADGTITFEAINYNQVGEHEYTIQEVQGSLGGITYDQNKFEVTVFVTDNKEGKLVASVNYTDEDEHAQFTNTYKAGPGSVALEAKKVLAGKVLEADQFEFELVDNEKDEVIQTATNNASGQVIFGEIEFTEEGTYQYTIREKLANLGGITYDETEHGVTVTVVDGGKGFLVATAVYDNGPAVFNNEYKPAPGSIVPEAKKILEGQELRSDQFEFTLTDESGDVIQTVNNNSDGQVIFDEITYDSVGTHTYIIKETTGVQDGVTYDTENYTVVVTVIDDGEGNLVAKENYVGGPAVFTNTYTPNPDSVVIEASKILNGQGLRNGQFTFELLDEEGNVLQTKKNNSNGQIIFDEITYEVGGTHEYVIREVEGVQGGVTYDTTEYKVEVTVTDDGVGTLTAEVKYNDGPAVFTNIYEAAADSVVFEASKVLKGQDLRKGQFTFELLDIEGEVIETVTNNSKGQIIFSEINYEEVGEHLYTIREVKGSQGGMAYDDTIYEVVVTVTDNGEGSLVAEVEYVGGPVVFNNIYTPAQDSVVFEASKVLKGQNLREGQFTFELVDSEGKVLQTKKNNANGQIIFDELNFIESGTYKYTIYEVIGNQEGITYDSSKFEITVGVVDDGNGQLTATAEYVDVPAIFINTYEDPSTGLSGGGYEKPGDSDSAGIDVDKTDAPKTGDNSPILGYALLMLLALSSIIFIIYRSKKEKRESAVK